MIFLSWGNTSKISYQKFILVLKNLVKMKLKQKM